MTRHIPAARNGGSITLPIREWQESLDAALGGVREKLHRADRHSEELEVVWSEFLGLEPSPYEFPIHVDPQTGDHTIYGQARIPPPLTLSAIVGDIVHNLRSALDHLAWAIVERAGGKPGRHTYFPLCDTEDRWGSEVEFRRRKRDRKSPLEGLDPDGPYWAFIQSVQPYKGAYYADALSTLRVLSNADKHRTLLISGVYPDPDDFAAIINWRPEAVLRHQEILLRPDEPMKHGAPVAYLNFDPNKPDPEVSVEGELAFDVAFSDGDWDSDRPALADLSAALRQYVEYATGLWLDPPHLEDVAGLGDLIADLAEGDGGEDIF